MEPSPERSHPLADQSPGRDAAKHAPRAAGEPPALAWNCRRARRINLPQQPVVQEELGGPRPVLGRGADLTLNHQSDRNCRQCPEDAAGRRIKINRWILPAYVAWVLGL